MSCGCCSSSRRHVVVSSSTAVCRQVCPRRSTTSDDAPAFRSRSTICAWSVSTARWSAVCFNHTTHRISQLRSVTCHTGLQCHLPAKQHGWTRPALIPARQPSIYWKFAPNPKEKATTDIVDFTSIQPHHNQPARGVAKWDRELPYWSDPYRKLRSASPTFLTHDAADAGTGSSQYCCILQQQRSAD